MNPPVRTAYGLLTGWVGVASNLLLCAVKIVIGFLSGSIAVMADGINNLSDAGSSVITLVGFKLAAVPADDEHPFGHGRIEYIAGLVVAIIIIAVGLNFLKTSLERIIHSVEIEISAAALVILLLTLPVKLWMFFFYRNIAHRIASDTIRAVAFDSLSDILTTGLVILSLVIAPLTRFPVDGCAGLLVAVFIVTGGINVVRSIINPLLGSTPDHALVEELRSRLLQCPGIQGVHDIMIHNYGPNLYFATAHAEVPPNPNAIYLHDTLEAAEVEIARTMPVRLLLHCDPFSSANPELKKWRTMTEDLIGTIDPCLKVYDFRLEKANGRNVLDFSLMIPRKYIWTEKALKEKITEMLRRKDPDVEITLHITHSFV